MTHEDNGVIVMSRWIFVGEKNFSNSCHHIDIHYQNQYGGTSLLSSPEYWQTTELS